MVGGGREVWRVGQCWKWDNRVACVVSSCTSLSKQATFTFLVRVYLISS